MAKTGRPAAFVWTEARDAQLREMRKRGESYAAIGRAVECSQFIAWERGRKLKVDPERQRRAHGARALDKAQAAPAPADAGDKIDMRGPLPAGHPLSWRECLGMTVPYPHRATT